MREKLEELELKKNNLISDKETKENEIIECNDLINSFKEKLSQNKDIKNIYEEIENLKLEKQSKFDLLNSLNQRAQSILKEQGGNLLLEDYIISVKNFLEQDNIASEYSIRISIDLLDQILDDCKCICGRTFDKNSDNFRTLDELRHKFKKSEMNSFVSIFKMIINEYYQKKDYYEEELKNILRDTDEVDHQIELLQIRISNLEERIQGYSSNETNLKEIENSLKKYENKVNKFEVEKQSITYEIDRVDEDIKGISKQIVQEEKQELALKDDTKRRDYLKALKDGFSSILSDYSTDMREKISVETTKIFKSLISQNDIDMVSNIVINEDYEIQVYGWNGKLITSDVSAGQRQIISLSFVTALAKVASGSTNKMNVPLFMDTPFGRISGTNRDNLINILPELTKQWILLMTDTEFTRAEEREFKSTKKINTIYKLNKIRDGYTVIEKVEDIYNVSIARR